MFNAYLIYIFIPNQNLTIENILTAKYKYVLIKQELFLRINKKKIV